MNGLVVTEADRRRNNPFVFNETPTNDHLDLLFNRTGFATFAWNTLWVGVLVVLITLALSLPAAYSLARLDRPWGGRMGIAISALFGAIFTFTDMTVVYVLTRGGPTNETQVLASWAFFRGIEGSDVGQGAAIALFLFPLLLAAAIAILRAVRRMEIG